MRREGASIDSRPAYITHVLEHTSLSEHSQNAINKICRAVPRRGRRSHHGGSSCAPPVESGEGDRGEDRVEDRTGCTGRVHAVLA